MTGAEADGWLAIGCALVGVGSVIFGFWPERHVDWIKVSVLEHDLGLTHTTESDAACRRCHRELRIQHVDVWGNHVDQHGRRLHTPLIDWDEMYRQAL